MFPWNLNKFLDLCRGWIDGGGGGLGGRRGTGRMEKMVCQCFFS